MEDKYREWMKVCYKIKNKLYDEDCILTVNKLVNIIVQESNERIYVTDVGNCEYWFSRAFERANKEGVVLCSKSFGSLGASLGRAIGTYYALGKTVVCVIGDQGFQFNVQELAYISQWNLPIKIIIVNNFSSGMIADREIKMGKNNLVHVSKENGYLPIDIKSIASAYKIAYTKDDKYFVNNCSGPIIYELETPYEELIPNLPRGNVCQKMEPYILEEKYMYLDRL